MVTTVDVKDASGSTVTLNAPAALGRAAAASSKPVTLSSEDFAVIDGLETLITATNTAIASTNTAIASTNTKLDTLHTDIGTTLHADVDGMETLATATNTAIAATNTALGTMNTAIAATNTALAALSQGWAFEATLAPTVTNGAYSANDIVGGLLTFSNVARAADELFMVTGVSVICKAAVLPTWTLILANANFGGSTVTDNAALNIVAADALTIRKNLPVANLYDLGTPNMWSVDGLGIVMAPASGTRNIFGLLVDGTGVTLTSTSDIQITLRGVGAK